MQSYPLTSRERELALEGRTIRIRRCHAERSIVHAERRHAMRERDAVRQQTAQRGRHLLEVSGLGAGRLARQANHLALGDAGVEQHAPGGGATGTLATRQLVSSTACGVYQPLIRLVPLGAAGRL
jgi:hypothetical protein